MRPSTVVSVATLALAATALAADAFNIRPGLWSTTSITVMSGAPLYIEGMPESSRAQYAKQWADSIKQPITDKDDENCITEEEIRKTDIFESMQDKDASCKQTVTKQTATQMAGVVECNKDKTTTRTEIDYVATSPTVFKGTLKSTITSPNGTTTMNITMNGKWMAASCPAEDEEEETTEEE